MTTTAPDTALVTHHRATQDGPAPWTADELEHRLRELAVSRYHDRHPFNQRMHEGRLTPAELRTWVANRFYYQCNIPIKDALILSKLHLPAQRRSWLRRIQDHDGHTDQDGGIERWLQLGEAVGLRRDELLDHRHLLPGVRLAVDGYVNFCRNSRRAGSRGLVPDGTLRSVDHADAPGNLSPVLPLDQLHAAFHTSGAASPRAA